MAALPDLTQTAAPVPRAAGGVAAYTPQQSQVGQIMRASANDLSDAASIIAATNDRQDAILAQAAANNLQQARTTAEFDPQNGFRSRKESQAVGKSFIDDYTSQFQTAQDGIRAGLENDNQRRMFDQHAQVQGLQFKAGLLQHQAEQTDRFNDTTADATLKLALRSMAQRPGDELNFQTSLAQINGILDSNGARKGLPAEQVAELKGTYLDAAYSARITSIMQGLPGISAPDPIKAAAMFKQVEDKLGPSTINHLGGELTQAIKLNTLSKIAQSEGAAIAEKFDYTHTTEAIKFIDSLNYQPEQLAAIRSEVEHRHVVQQSDADKSNALVVGKLHEMIESNMSISRIMATPEYRQARDKGEVMQRFRERQEHQVNLQAAAETRDYHRTQRLQAEEERNGLIRSFPFSDPSTLAGYSREQIAGKVLELGPKNTERLLMEWDRLKTDEAKLREAKMDHTMFQGIAAEVFGADKVFKPTNDMKETLARAKTRVDSALTEWRVNNPKANPDDVRDKASSIMRGMIAEEVLLKGVAGMTWGPFGTKTNALAVPDKSAAKIVVPDDARAAIIKRARDQTGDPNFMPTEEQIGRAHLTRKQRDAANR